MTANQALLKADLTLNDLATGGGLMQPEESNSFIRKLLVAPTVLAQVRVVEMLNSERNVNKIGFGKRILRKATSSTALPASHRAKPTTEQIKLNTQEVIAEVRLPYDVVEDNIMRAQAATNSPSNQGQMGGIKDLLISMIAERAALDLEDLAINADPAYSSALVDATEKGIEEEYMQMFTGYLKKAQTAGHLVDAANAGIGKETFKKGVKAMPKQYRRFRPQMKHFVSPDQETEYQDSLANRGTAMGDANVVGIPTLWAYGSKVEGVALMPDDAGIYTDPMNLLFGIQRQISMEYDKDITARVYIIVLTARVAIQTEEDDALVGYDNIGTA